MAPTYEATVTDITQLAPRVLQLTLELGDDRFLFDPGQWVNFRFPEGVSRAYTLASAPEFPQCVQICIRLGEGRGAAALRRLEQGAGVSIEGPFGEFLLPPSDDRSVVFLAGDTGIAPVRSIVLHMVAVNDPRKATVLYEPDHHHVLYADDFDPLARDGAIRHESGRIEMLIERNRRFLASSVKMAAGFDGFLDRVRTKLDELALGSSELIVESFGPEP